MSPMWSYFWPLFAIGLVAGAFGMWRSYRQGRAGRSRRDRRLTVGLAPGVAIAGALIWHWPLGAADRLAGTAERTARTTLVYYELPQINAVVQRAPMTRRVLLSGQADAFQRRELVRIMNEIPGVGSVAWQTPSGPGRSRMMLPLLVEAAMAALAGLAFGMLAAHIVELRRRANAEWSW